MKVTATAPGREVGAMLVKINDDELSEVPMTFWFTVDDATWLLEGTVVVVGEGDQAVPEITRLTISKRPDGVPIADDMLRHVSLSKAKSAALQQIAVPWKRIGDKYVRQPEATAHALTAKRATARRGRRPTEDDLREAVDAYRQAVADGRKDRLVAVGEAIYASTATAQRRIERARELGMIGADE